MLFAPLTPGLDAALVALGAAGCASARLLPRRG